jgi:tetratricopeptide (TPR) repeat protein
MKEYLESLDIFREAFHLRQREAHLARKSEFSQEAQLKMAKIRHNIGCVNYELGKLDDAKDSYIEAIEQQKAAFGTWSTPFMIMTDMTKPGFLTMASTMCNKGEFTRVNKNWLSRINQPPFLFYRYHLCYY